MKKTIKTIEYAMIEFTDEEIRELGLKKEWPYSITEEGGRIIMTPYTTVEIDLDEYSKEDLVRFIELSAEKNMTIHEVVEYILEEKIKNEV